MRSDGDDDALSWDGDDALEARRPELRPRAPRPKDAGRKEVAPESATAPAAASDPAATRAAEVAPETTEDAQGIGTVSLVAFGILGGMYLLYTVGWVIGGVGMQAPVMFTLPAFLYQAALWLAVLAPALWFTAVLILTRGAKDWIRIVWLIAGAALLVPWPFVVSGGGGAL